MKRKSMLKLEPLRLMKWAKKPMKKLPDDLEANYIAGLIDGEGSIFIETCQRKTRKGSRLYYYPRLVIEMNSPLLKDLWGVYGGFLGQYPHYRLTNGNYLYCWKLWDPKILKPFLQKILPFLREKQKQAKLLLKALETTDKKELEKLRRRISKLNRRYYGPDPLFYPEENEA